MLAIELLEHIAIKRGLKTLDSLQLASALTFTKNHMLKLFMSSDKVHVSEKQKFYRESLINIKAYLKVRLV